MPSDRQLVRQAGRLAEEAPDIAAALPGLLAAFREQRNVLPSPGAGRGSGIPDPTGSIAVNADRDPAVKARAETERDIAELTALFARLRRRHIQWTQTRPVVQPPSQVEPGCWVMKAIAREGPGWWEPVHLTTDCADHLEVPLDRPRPLGQWAYRFIRDHGRLPTLEERRRHAAGLKVRVPVERGSV